MSLYSNPQEGFSKYYEKFVPPEETKSHQQLSMMFLKRRHFFHRKFDDLTRAKQLIQSANPHPRLTSFVNGSVYFPIEAQDEVLQHIANDVLAENRVFWNQIGYEADGIRFVVDIDSQERVFTPNEINIMVMTLSETLKVYYSDPSRPGVVIMGSTCGPRLKKGKLSMGIHFVCHVRVTIQQALQLTYAFKLRLQNVSALNTQDMDVDASIYKENARSVSLRMVYAHKLDNCVVCDNLTEKRMACNTCERRGILVSKMTYEPKLCVNSEGKLCAETFAQEHSNFHQILRNHAVWSQERDERTDFSKPLQDPVYESSKTLRNTNLNPTKKKNTLHLIRGTTKKTSALTQVRCACCPATTLGTS